MEYLPEKYAIPVVPRADHLAVVLPVEGGAAEVNEPHLGVLHLPDVLPLQGRSCIFFVNGKQEVSPTKYLPASPNLEAWQIIFVSAIQNDVSLSSYIFDEFQYYLSCIVRDLPVR